MNEIILHVDVDKRFSLEPLWPEPLRGEYSDLNRVNGRPYVTHSWREKRDLMETGYVIQPNDCPPIRNINTYGYEVKCPGIVNIVKNSGSRHRKTTETDATYGIFTHSGDKCNYSDSTFLSSWLANSGYVKITTGLIVYCPLGIGLYQGPVPYYGNHSIEVFSAIEYGNSSGVKIIDGKKHFRVDINFVIQVNCDRVELYRGAPLGVFYPVLPSRKIKLCQVHA